MVTPGTVHLLETDKRGDVLWDVVVCESCLAEHVKTVTPQRGDTRKQWPWVREPRACDWCDDSDNAPEFKFKALASVLLCLLLPVLAEARQAATMPVAALVAGNVLDAVSTEIALQGGGTREVNPVLGQSVGRRLALKSAGTVFQVWAVRKLGQRHPKWAKVIGYGGAAALGGVSLWNFKHCC